MQRHNAEWYAVTHQEVHCVSLSYNNEYAANKSPPSTAKGNNGGAIPPLPILLACTGMTLCLP